VVQGSAESAVRLFSVIPPRYDTPIERAGTEALPPAAIVLFKIAPSGSGTGSCLTVIPQSRSWPCSPPPAIRLFGSTRDLTVFILRGRPESDTAGSGRVESGADSHRRA